MIDTATEEKTYLFKELSKEAKEHAIKKYYDDIEDYPFLEDDLKNELECLDIHEYWSDVKLSYSLGHCQGDGLSFSGDFDFKKYLSINKDKYKLDQYDIDFLNGWVYKVQSEGNRGHYTFARKDQVEWQENYNIEDEINEYDEFRADIKRINFERIEKIWLDIFDDIQYEYVELGVKLQEYGYNTIDYRMSEDEFEEYSESNDCQYDEEGNLI